METREQEWSNHRPAAKGGSTVDITCPFCGAVVTAYIWSLSGGGKKCECGALHCYGRSMIDYKEPKGCRKEYNDRLCGKCPSRTSELVSHPGGSITVSVEKSKCEFGHWEDDF